MRKSINLNTICKSLKNECENTQIFFFEGKNGEVFAGVFGLVFDEQSDVLNEINVECYDTSKMKAVSFLHMAVFRDRMFLNVIYTDVNYRQLGLAKNLLRISEDILKDFGYNEFVGEFGPHDKSTELSLDELRNNALLFYKSLGYDILDFKHFYENPELYPKNLEDVFFARELIYKRMDSKKNINIIEVGDYFVEESLAQKLGLVKNFGE